MIIRTFTCFVLISLIYIAMVSECFSQKYIYLETYNVDSLHSLLPDQHAEDRINTLNRLSTSLCYAEFEKSEQYAQEAMNLAKDLDYQEGIADSYRNFGHIAFFQSNFPEALNNYLESLHLYEDLDRKYTVARLYLDIAKTHLSASNYEKAFEYGNIGLIKFREPIKGGKTVGNVRDTTMLILGMALAYADLGMYGEALQVYHKVLEVGEKNNFGNIEMMLTTLLVANCYFWSGENDSAVEYWEKALEFPESNLSLKSMKYHTITSRADFYHSDGKVDSAIFDYQKAFEWFNENGFLYWAMYYSNSLSYFYFENHEYDDAEKYSLLSEKLFDEMRYKNSWYRYDSLKYVISYGPELYYPMPQSQMKEMMWWQGRQMYYGLYQLNEETKQTVNALKYFIEYYNATDTLNYITQSRETIELQTKYESERKDQQIETLSLENELKESRLKQSSYLLIGSIGLFIIILMVGYILYRQNKLKANQQMILLQQKLFRSQMNPHFIFNSLTSIQGFITEKDPRTASRYLSKFSKLIRSILDSSVEELISLEDEIATIENYLELQKVRYEDMFDYLIEVDEKIDTETMTIPPMLAQPFIENSIEHGFKHKKNKGTLKILFGLKNNILRIEVEDDGVGREKAKEILLKQNKDHRSIATDITRDRLKVLNKKLRQKISLAIIDLENVKGNPAGTKVTFEIPAITN